MSHGTDGKVLCKASQTWITPEEQEDRRRRRELLGANRRLAFPCPHVIRDEQAPTQSMLDGKHYDSKRAMRESYREHNRRTGESIIEVGDDPSYATREGVRNTYHPSTKLKRETTAERNARKAEYRAVGEKAISQTNLTSYRRDEIK